MPLRGGTEFIESGVFEQTNIVIKSGRIAAIGNFAGSASYRSALDLNENSTSLD